MRCVTVVPVGSQHFYQIERVGKKQNWSLYTLKT